MNGPKSARTKAATRRFQADITDVLRREGQQDDHRSRRGRSRRSGEAARQAGLAARSRIASGIRGRPASGRRYGSRRCRPTLHRPDAVDAEPGALGHRARGAHRRRCGATDCACRSRLHVGDMLLADDTLRGHRRRGAPPHRAVRSRHRRLPQRTAVEPGSAHTDRCASWSSAGERGESIDRVRSYTALRSVGVQGDRFMLNGRPLLLRMVLDQGYWPEPASPRPTTTRCAATCELAKAMGFNGVRKHQKIEDPRYLYWADQLGLLVWEEMPSAYRFTRKSIERLTREWTEAIERDYSHPCIVTWVPFNESWGVPEPARQPGAAALRAGAVSPDEDAGSDAAGDRQRRLGERAPPTSSASTITMTKPERSASATASNDVDAAPVPARAAGRPHADARTGSANAEPADRADGVRRHRLLATIAKMAPGATRARGRPRRSSPSSLQRLLTVVRTCPRSRASATPSLPTPIRRRTGFSMPIGRRKFLWSK